MWQESGARVARCGQRLELLQIRQARLAPDRRVNARRIVVSGIYEVQDLILIADRKRIVVQDPDTDAAEVEGEPTKRQGEMERSPHGRIRATRLRYVLVNQFHWFILQRIAPSHREFHSFQQSWNATAVFPVPVAMVSSNRR